MKISTAHYIIQMIENQDEDVNERKAKVRSIMVGVVLSPLHCFGVVINSLGNGRRLSARPGVTRERGIASGSLVLILAALLLIVFGFIAIVATGGNIPIIGEGEDEQVDQTTPTAIPTPSPTPTQIATNTESSTLTKNPRSDLERFEADFRNQINITRENDSFTGVPILATEYHKVDRDHTELWIVFWECDKLDSLKEQRVAIGNVYANTVGNSSASQPDRLRVYGVTNLEQYNDTITHISTAEAESAWNREISPTNYTENWNERQRVPTSAETEIAYQMVVNDSGEQLADEAFNQHHREIGGCPGGARDPTPPNGTDSSERISATGLTLAAEPIAP